MANNNETTTKFKVDISELKKNFQEASRQIRLANSEFKAATSGMDKWSDSADGISAKIKQLNSVVDAQKKQLQSLCQQYALTVAEQGENSRGAEELRIKINNQRAAIGETEKQIRNYTNQLNEMTSEQTQTKTAMDKLKDTINDQESELEKLKTQYANLVIEQGEGSSAAQELAGKIESLSTELNENRNKLSEAEKAADEFDNTLEDVDESADETANGGLSVFGVALGNLIADVVSAAISKLKDLAAETINVGKAFDSSMSQVQAVSGATGEEYDRLRAKAKEMGSTTKFTASEAADAFNYMAMAGWKTEDMLDGIEGIMNLAAASGSDLATTSDIVTDALTAMGYGAEDAGKLADVMAAASSNANTNVEMMGETFKYVAPLIGTLGYDMNDAAVAVGLMANSGIKASQGGTALRTALSRLVKPTKQMKNIMIDLGLATKETIKTIDDKKLEKAQTKVENKTIDLEKAQIKLNEAIVKYGKDSSQAETASLNLQKAQNNLAAAQAELAKEQEGTATTTKLHTEILTDAEGNMKSLAEVIGFLREKFAGLDESQQAQAAAILFGQEAMSGMLAIINSSEEDFNKLTEAVENSEGVAKKMSDTMLNNLGGDMTLLSSKLEGVQLAIYEKFEPALRKGTKVLDKLLDAVNFVVDHSDEFIAALAGMAAGVATYVAYTTALKVMKDGWMSLLIVQKLVTAQQAVMNAVMAINPIGLIIAAIVALVAAFVVLWNKSEKFRNFWIGLWESIKETLFNFFDAWVDGWNIIKDFFTTMWDGIKEKSAIVWGAITGFFTTAWKNIKAVWGAATGFFSGIWDSIKSIFSTIAQWINDNVFQPIIKFFQPVINFYKTAWNIIFQLAEGCWNLIKLVWENASSWFNETIIAPLIGFFTGLWDAIKTNASAAWDFIKKVWSVVGTWFNEKIVQPLLGFFSGLWNGIKTSASNTWTEIKKIWNVVSNWFNNTIIKPVSGFFKGMWDGLKKGAKEAWTGIKEVFGKVAEWFEDKFKKAWQKVKDVFSTGGKIFDGIKDGIVSAFKTVVNAIIRGINKVIAIPFNAINKALDTIRGVSIGDFQPFEGLISRFDIPQIPELAKGGVLKKGQIGFLEGDGAEAVVPLEKNTRWLDEIASRLNTKMEKNPASLTSSKSSNVVNNFYQNNYSPKALTRLELYRQGKNLLRMKGV